MDIFADGKNKIKKKYLLTPAPDYLSPAADTLLVYYASGGGVGGEWRRVMVNNVIFVTSFFTVFLVFCEYFMSPCRG